jgi:hypothetical protein
VSDGKYGQTLLDVVAKSLKMNGRDSLDSGPPRVVEVGKSDKMVGQRSAPVARPGCEGREQSALIDQAGLQREKTKK